MIKQSNQSRQVLCYASNTLQATHLYTLVCRFHVSVLISKQITPISAQNTAILTNDGKIVCYKCAATYMHKVQP